MPLDSKRQAILDVYCHVYEKLFDTLKTLNEVAAEISPNVDFYTIVTDCFDPAVKEFGENPPSTEDKSKLLIDLTNKITALFSFKFSSNPALLAFSEKFKTAILGSVDPNNKIKDFNAEAEKISQTCYTQFCSTHYSGLNRVTELIKKPGNMTHVFCIPKKTVGISEINFEIGTVDFYFSIYVNLPFYFFHEYLSHIHSASLFCEFNCEPSIFEDGWLIYVEQQEYMRYLHSHSLSVDALYCKEYYLNKYIYSLVSGEKENRYV